MEPAEGNPYRDGLPPAPPGPPEGEQHAFRDAAPFLSGLALGPVLPLALLLAGGGGWLALAVLLALLATLALLPPLRALGRAERYAAERRREEAEIRDWPERERWEVAAVLHRYGLRGDALHRAVEQVAADPRRWVDFMMRFELDLLEPRPGHATREGLGLAGGALLGGAAVIALATFAGLPAAAAGGALLAALGAGAAGAAGGEAPFPAGLRGLLVLGAAALLVLLARAAL